jgi:hypothetical protein
VKMKVKYGMATKDLKEIATGDYNKDDLKRALIVAVSRLETLEEKLRLAQPVIELIEDISERAAEGAAERVRAQLAPEM